MPTLKSCPRVRAVVAALGNVPHLLVRSSSSRGVHVYLFFERPYSAADVNEVVSTRVDALLGKEVDKLFPSQQALRLPFGSGSCIVEDDSTALVPRYAEQLYFKHLAAVEDEHQGTGALPLVPRVLKRDLPATMKWLAQTVPKLRIPLSALGSPRGVLGKGKYLEQADADAHAHANAGGCSASAGCSGPQSRAGEGRSRPPRAHGSPRACEARSAA